MSKSHKNIKFSDSHKQNISKTLIEKKRPYLKENLNWRRNLGKSIVCLQNQKIYHTIREAAKDLNISHENLGKAIKRNRSIKGLTFVYWRKT